jgi:hypothetical protein
VVNETPAEVKGSGLVALRSFVGQALGFRALAHTALAVILLLCLAIPVAHALRLGPIWPSLIGFALVLGLARVQLSHRTAVIAIAVCFAAYLTTQLLVLANHWVEPVSDFARQWNVAIDYAENGITQPFSPQTQRGLPFYYPLVVLFGKSSTVYLTANVVLSSSTFLMSAWIARRYFGWAAAAKTSLLLLFGFEVYFANTFPSHDVLGSFGVVLFLVLLTESEVLVGAGRFSRPRIAAISALALAMSLTITWVEWQRTMGMFCALALLFWGIASFIQRAARWRLRLAIGVTVLALSAVQNCGLKSGGLKAIQPPTDLTSSEMSLLVFGSDEGDGRFADWYRNARMATALQPDEITSLSKVSFVESLRSNPRRKYRNYLDRQLNFLRTGQDSGWYLTIDSPRWLDAKDLRKLYNKAEKWTPPLWWALALMVAIAAMFRRDVLFDHRAAPVIIVTAFMTIMGLVAETQARYAMFFVFLWPIYAGAPFVANPLGGLVGPAPIDRRKLRLTILRVTTSVAVVIAVPALLLGVAPRLFGPRLADFHYAEIIIGKTPTSVSKDTGAPPQRSVRRNVLTFGDDVTGSHDLTVTTTTSVSAKRDASTLRFVIYNEIGEPLESPGQEPKRPDVMPNRALRVVVDGQLRQTIDLANPFTPRAYQIEGFDEGEHVVRLELDLGGATSISRAGGVQVHASVVCPADLRPDHDRVPRLLLVS